MEEYLNRQMDTMKLSPQRVAIMMNTLVRGRMGGTEVYADELISRLQPNDELAYLDVLAEGVAALSFDRPTINLKQLTIGTSGFSRFANFVYNSLFVRKQRRIIGPIDLAYYPFTAVTPALRARKGSVVTIHDLQHRDFPHLFSRAQRVYRYLTYERSAKKATHVIVISDFTALSVKRLLGIPQQKITRIYPGIDHEFFTQRKPVDFSAPGFLYYPARGLAHKNHARLIEAMEIVRKTQPNLRLILTGADRDLLGELPNYVTHEGHVTRARVRELFQKAHAVVFPSLYEGFGFPPIEAMASGCPVVSSTAGSLPEVLGNAALYIDPYDPHSIAEGISEVLSNPDKWVSEGLAQAAKYNWDDTAGAHQQLLIKLCR